MTTRLMMPYRWQPFALRRWHRAHALAAIVAALVLSAALPADARMARAVTLGDLTASAGRIVRARCIGADAGTVALAGAALEATTYTFEVSDPLKGAGTGTLAFRQVGTPERGPRDLGARAGLPVYTPGVEYVLFLLPEGSLGLTSPAGAGDGAFVVRGERVTSVNGSVSLAPPAVAGARASATGSSESSVPYETFRDIVRQLVTP